MDLKLDQKVAIVTGGASNIGRSISLALAEEEAIVRRNAAAVGSREGKKRKGAGQGEENQTAFE